MRAKIQLKMKNTNKKYPFQDCRKSKYKIYIFVPSSNHFDGSSAPGAQGWRGEGAGPGASVGGGGHALAVRRPVGGTAGRGGGSGLLQKPAKEDWYVSTSSWVSSHHSCGHMNLWSHGHICNHLVACVWKVSEDSL